MIRKILGWVFGPAVTETETATTGAAAPAPEGEPLSDKVTDLEGQRERLRAALYKTKRQRERWKTEAEELRREVNALKVEVGSLRYRLMG